MSVTAKVPLRLQSGLDSRVAEQISQAGVLSATALKLQTRLRNQVGKAVCDYAMLREGDRVAKVHQAIR